MSLLAYLKGPHFALNEPWHGHGFRVAVAEAGSEV